MRAVEAGLSVAYKAGADLEQLFHFRHHFLVGDEDDRVIVG